MDGSRIRGGAGERTLPRASARRRIGAFFRAALSPTANWTRSGSGSDGLHEQADASASCGARRGPRTREPTAARCASLIHGPRATRATTANNVQRELRPMPANRRKRKKNIPQLKPLPYGRVYCELGKEIIHAGQLVAWWRVSGVGGRMRWAAYCADCHHACVRAGRALR